MILNKTKIIICGVILLLVGYVAGAIIKVPFFENNMLNGDIGKANLYNKSTGNDSKASVEMLRNDTTYRNQMLASYLLLNSRIQAADSLANATVKATEGVAELKNLNSSMKDVAIKAKNAKQLYYDLFTETEKVLSGKESSDYEQLVSNAGHAFTVIDNEMSSCADVVSALSDYGLKTNNKPVLSAASGWIEYGAENAVLSGDKEDIAAWKAVYSSVQKEKSLALLSTSYPTLQSTINKIPSVKVNGKIIRNTELKSVMSSLMNSMNGRGVAFNNQSSNKLGNQKTELNKNLNDNLLKIRSSENHIGLKQSSVDKMQGYQRLKAL